MKKIFTLLVLSLLLTTVSFGQKSLKNHDKSVKKRIETRLSNSDLSKKSPMIVQRLQKNTTEFDKFAKSAKLEKHTLDSLVERMWDSYSEQWYDSSKEEIKYDENGNIIEHYYYYKSDPDGAWIVDWKTVYTRDNNGYVTLESDSVWNDIDKIYVASWRLEYTVDDNGNVTNELDYEWDSDEEEWIAVWQETNTYNENGDVSETIYYGRDETTGDLVFYIKEEISYDENYNIVQFLDSFWDVELYQWIISYKVELTYDSNNNVTQLMNYYNYGSWDVYSKSEYAYDEDGNMIEEIDFQAGQNPGEFVIVWRGVYDYDSNGNPIQEIYYEYDSESEEFIEYSKYNYTYDLLYSLSELFVPQLFWFVPDYSFQIVNKPLAYSVSEWDTETEDWVEVYKGTYFYSDNATSVADLDIKALKIYPNPATEYVVFNLNNNSGKAFMELYDLQGRKVLSKEINNNEKINLNAINSGMYLYHLFVDDNKLTGKLLKE